MLQTKLICAVSLVTLIGCTTQTPSSYQKSESSVNTPVAQSEFSQSEPIQVNAAAEQENQRRENQRQENQRQIVRSKIKQLEQQSELLSQRMIGRQQKISNLELQKSQIEADFRAYYQKVESFKQQNKDVIGCRNAAKAGQDESNKYSQNEKNIANAVTFVCGAGFLSDEKFRNKVLHVNDQLSQADNNIKNFQNNFQAVRSQIESEQQLLAQEQSQASKLAVTIRDYQSRLELPSQTEI